MLKKVFLLLAVVFLGLLFLYPLLEERYQQSVDVQRMEDLLLMGRWLEAYFEETGHFPFADRAEANQFVVVLIGTDHQIENLAIPSEFKVFTEDELEEELSSILGQSIELPHDPQDYATNERPTIYDYKVFNGDYFLKAYLYDPNDYTVEVSEHFNTFELTNIETCRPCAGGAWFYGLWEE